MGRLEGRIAPVTGAGRGFGEAIALARAREGADVVVNYRQRAVEVEKVAAAIRAIGRRALVHQADVAREEDVRRLIGAAGGRMGGLDVPVNNAGVMVPGPYLEVPIERYDEMFRINVTGTMLCTRYALPHMIARRHAPGRAHRRS